jgi:hypothetical protein
MVRYVFFILAILVLFFVVKAVVRSLFSGSSGHGKKSRLPGDEMVLDPECHTYVVKRRAVARRIGDKLCYFCSDACAKQYEDKSRT